MDLKISGPSFILTKSTRKFFWTCLFVLKVEVEMGELHKEVLKKWFQLAVVTLVTNVDKRKRCFSAICYWCLYFVYLEDRRILFQILCLGMQPMQISCIFSWSDMPYFQWCLIPMLLVWNSIVHLNGAPWSAHGCVKDHLPSRFNRFITCLNRFNSDLIVFFHF